MKTHASARSVILQILTVTGAVLILDATTKVAAEFLASRHVGQGVILPVQNPDFSLGVASASPTVMLALSTLGILFFGAFTARAAIRGKLGAWVPGLLIGGAAANLVDRLVFGAVHDWLHLPKVVVNLADLAVLIGLVGYFASLVLIDRRR